MSSRLRTLTIVLAGCALLLAGALADAARRRTLRDAANEELRAIVDVAGPDLALSSSARWLRHPSQAEAGAAIADLPSSLDVDPAGSLIGPPRELLRVGGQELR